MNALESVQTCHTVRIPGEVMRERMADTSLPDLQQFLSSLRSMDDSVHDYAIIDHTITVVECEIIRRLKNESGENKV